MFDIVGSGPSTAPHAPKPKPPTPLNQLHSLQHQSSLTCTRCLPPPPSPHLCPSPPLPFLTPDPVLDAGSVNTAQVREALHKVHPPHLNLPLFVLNYGLQVGSGDWPFETRASYDMDTFTRIV